jgi:hypothetical protein
MKGKELGFLGAVVPFHRDLIDAARQAANCSRRSERLGRVWRRPSHAANRQPADPY